MVDNKKVVLSFEALNSKCFECLIPKAHSVRNEIVASRYTSHRPAFRSCVGDVLYHSGSHLCHG